MKGQKRISLPNRRTPKVETVSVTLQLPTAAAEWLKEAAKDWPGNASIVVLDLITGAMEREGRL
jgi:hypothetical protein